MNIQFKPTSIAKVLIRFEEIAFAYLFGSAQNGIIYNNSDIDIGIFLTNKEKDIHIRFAILKALEKTIPGFDNFDLVILNTANSIIAMKAIQGTQLFVKQEYNELLAGFYSLTCRQFEDDNFWMKKQLEYRGYEVQWDN